MLNRSIILLLLALPLTLAVAACGDDTEEVDTPNNASGDGNGGESAIEVSASDFSFSPPKVSVDPGMEVSVQITNNGNVQHTFTMDDLGIDETIDPGEEVTVSLALETDQRFYCRFHESAGMEGTISTGVSGDASGNEATPTEDPAGEFSY